MHALCDNFPPASIRLSTFENQAQPLSVRNGHPQRGSPAPEQSDGSASAGPLPSALANLAADSPSWSPQTKGPSNWTRAFGLAWHCQICSAVLYSRLLTSVPTLRMQLAAHLQYVHTVLGCYGVGLVLAGENVVKMARKDCRGGAIWRAGVLKGGIR